MGAAGEGERSSCSAAGVEGEPWRAEEGAGAAAAAGAAAGEGEEAEGAKLENAEAKTTPLSFIALSAAAVSSLLSASSTSFLSSSSATRRRSLPASSRNRAASACASSSQPCASASASAERLAAALCLSFRDAMAAWRASFSSFIAEAHWACFIFWRCFMCGGRGGGEGGEVRKGLRRERVLGDDEEMSPDGATMRGRERASSSALSGSRMKNAAQPEVTLKRDPPSKRSPVHLDRESEKAGNEKRIFPPPSANEPTDPFCLSLYAALVETFAYRRIRFGTQGSELLL